MIIGSRFTFNLLNIHIQFRPLGTWAEAARGPRAMSPASPAASPRNCTAMLACRASPSPAARRPACTQRNHPPSNPACTHCR